MRSEPTVLHIDLDAFYAAVEQRDKPSLRGKPVVVGGVGGRGVVATASYEARVFGVRSAMPTREARSRCPHAAYLAGRHRVYRATSAQVMAELAALSPLVEPLSLDEAYVDLAAAGLADHEPETLTRTGADLKQRIRAVTGGLTASVGIATSKLVAKIASDLRKPDGLVLVPPGTERALLDPLPVTVVPGVGPATAERLRRVGVTTVAALRGLAEEELVRLLGQAHGHALHRLARAEDDRPVVAEREAKSVSIEDTYDVDVADPRVLEGLLDRQATRLAERLRRARLSGRTVTVKVRLHDFSTHTRSATLASPTDQTAVLVRQGRRLLGEVDVSGGVRLLGIGVSGLADWVQEHLFADPETELLAPEVSAPDRSAPGGPDPAATAGRRWWPGMDVRHDDWGPGWVWGSGTGRVTVRFETAETGPGPVRTFAHDDPALSPAEQPGEA